MNTKFDDLFKAAATKYELNWHWLKAMCFVESSLGEHPRVKRGLECPTDIEGSTSEDKKSWGIMQVTLRTGKGLDKACTEVKLNDPAYSVNLSAKYLSECIILFHGRLEHGVKSYNQGPGNMNKEIKGIHNGKANKYWKKFKEALNKIEGEK